MAECIAFLRLWLASYRNWRKIRKYFPNASSEVNVIIKGDPDNLTIGPNVVIQSGTVLHLGGMEWCGFSGHISIGWDSVISPNCVIYGCGPGGVEIGDRFDCGPGVGIFSSRSDYEVRSKHIFAPVRIGDDVIIYANAVISPGVSIGTGAVVAAGAVVIDDVPPWTLVGGIPARVLKRLAR